MANTKKNTNLKTITLEEKATLDVKINMIKSLTVDIHGLSNGFDTLTKEEINDINNIISILEKVKGSTTQKSSKKSDSTTAVKDLYAVSDIVDLTSIVVSNDEEPEVKKTTAKKPATKKTGAKKSTTKKSTAKKTTDKKATDKKATDKKADAKVETETKADTKKSTAKKPATKKSTAKKSTAKKPTAKKSTAKKSTAKKSTTKKSTTKKDDKNGK